MAGTSVLDYFQECMDVISIRPDAAGSCGVLIAPLNVIELAI